MNKKIISIAGLLAVVLVGWVVLKPEPEVVVQTPDKRPIGALAGPDIPYPYISVGGLVMEFRSMDFNGATSTPCSFISPASTSTLAFTSFNVTTATGTALTVSLATSTVPNATTSVLTNDMALASGNKNTFSYSGTSTTALTASTWDRIPPNTYLTWGIKGVNQATGYVAAAFGGTCKAEFYVN